MFGKKSSEGTARILADEGLTGFTVNDTGFGHAWQHNKYIVEVTPQSGPPFRAETVARISAYDGPIEGDVVNCRYDEKSHEVELVLMGDPRYDPDLKKAAAEAQREALLSGAPAPAAPTSDGYTPLDPELQALMDADDAERAASAGAPAGAAPAGAASGDPAQTSRITQLQQLGDLHRQGVLTDSEFEVEKARILGTS